MSEEQGGSSSGQNDHPITLLEKVATTFAGLLIAAIVVVLLMDAVRPDAPARLAVDLGNVTRVGPSYQVPVTVHNHGDQSAKSAVVHLELVVKSTDSVVAESNVTVDWLPGQSSRHVVGLFPRGSSNEGMLVRADVRGYAVP